MAQIEPLRQFQEEDLPFFVSHPKSMILYEPRLGKTVMTCNVVARDPKVKSWLIACSKNAMATWIDHVKVWFAHLRPDLPIDFRIIRGKGSAAKLQRQELWDRPRKEGYLTIYLITFNALIHDFPHLVTKKHQFDCVVGDEVHTKLRNRKTKTTTIFHNLVRDAHRFHALSGTLAGKWGPADYWNLLNIINRHRFPSYWKWLNTFCVTIKTHFGTEIVGTKNMDAFHLTMDAYARIRKRAECAPQMPKVSRDILWVEPTDEQERLFNEIGRTSFAFTSTGGVIVARNALEQMTRKRQLLVCPKILDPNMGIGAAMEDILDRLAEAKENDDVEGQHIVIFTAVRKAIPFFEAALHAAGYNNVFTLVGGTEPEDLERITSAFRASKGIILCTTQFAQAFSLSSSAICYHIGWDWDPNNNKQAEDRLVGQVGDHTINSWYYAYAGTDDDDMAVRITLKNQIMSLTDKDPRLFKSKGE